jgi:hypothetical protein
VRSGSMCVASIACRVKESTCRKELARLLEPFQIRPQTIRFLCDDSEKATAKGYRRAQFEAAWRSYCTGDATRSQSGNIRHLRSV